MKMKRLFTLVLSLMMILSLSAPASAIDGENVYTKEEISSINEVNVAKYAKSFVETIDSTADVTAGNVLTMYSENENISGYCVDILEDGYPNGYVVVKFSDNDPVVSEFSLGENIRNPYAKIMERANIETDAAIFYSVGSNDYQVLDTSRNVIALDNSTELVSEKEFAVYKSAEKAMKQAAVQTRSGAVVSEFSLGENIRNPYAKIMERANIETDAAIFYSVGSNDYQVLDTSRNVIALDNSTELVSEKEFAVYKSAEKAMKQAAVQTRSGADDGLNYSDLDGWSVVSDSYEGSVKDGKEHTITGAGNVSLWYCQDHVENNNRTYACSVVALCNLAKYYRERGYDKISRSFTTLYDTMWEKAGTNSSGTTSNGNEAPAAKAFMEDLGYSCSYDSYLFDSYSDFTRDLGNNKPCIFTYGAKFGSKSGGHAVLAVGYVETTKYQYLRIADGWNDYLRYINFNGYDYTRKDGWSFSVSK